MEGVCEKCGWLIRYCHCVPLNLHNIDCFQPRVYTDIDTYPIEIHSKSQLREECKKRNLKAARLM